MAAGLLNKLSRKKNQEALEAVQATPNKEEAPKAAKKTEEKKETAKKATPKTPVSIHGNAHSVLVRPHVTEKAALQEANGVYTFVVERDATKIEIKHAIKEVYGVVPAKVRVLHMDGKKTRFGRIQGRRKHWKKAIITLPAGKRIDVHAGV